MLYRSRFVFVASAVALVAAGLVPCLGAGPKPPKIPAHISISVSPQSVAPGGEAEITLRLDPIEGVKINRYPKMKLQVPAADGLVMEAEVAVGNAKPPKPGADKTSNYFVDVEPLTLPITFEAAASQGSHEIEGKLVYYYCMPASGFCAPHRTAVKIPVVVR